jgi:6-pyruvoyltetrahydropterin/6-carboxytetrahydropterin synthase
MYTIGVRSHYEAAHFLRGYEGACARLHGHRYEVEAILVFEEPDESGLTIDFMEVDGQLRAVTGELDHRNLNELPAFHELQTSAENQARYLFDELKRRLGAAGRHLRSVRVAESPQFWAEYSEAPGA